MDEEELREELEQSIDANSLQFWLYELAAICNDKADHIRENWQDDALAGLWDKAANQITRTAESASVEAVS